MASLDLINSYLLIPVQWGLRKNLIFDLGGMICFFRDPSLLTVGRSSSVHSHVDNGVTLGLLGDSLSAISIFFITVIKSVCVLT